MTGLDTNILVRFLVKDEPEQSRRAKELLGALTPDSPGFVSLVALAELVWVLRSQYRMPKAQLILCLQRLLDSAELAIENQTAVHQAIERYAGSKANFADCVIERSGAIAGCRETVTFDVGAAKYAGMKLL